MSTAAALSDRTHGRWPWLAAAAAAPATALAWRRREQLIEDDAWVEWLPLVALLWHQSEEWVWPGGFMPFANREAIGSGADEFPLDRRVGMAVNVGLGWGLGLAAGLSRSAALSSLQLGLAAGNIGLHGGLAVRRRARNPGLLTAIGLFAPLVGGGYPALVARSRAGAGLRPVALGAAAGAALSVALMAGLRLRLRRSRR